MNVNDFRLKHTKRNSAWRSIVEVFGVLLAIVCFVGMFVEPVTNGFAALFICIVLSSGVTLLRDVVVDMYTDYLDRHFPLNSPPVVRPEKNDSKIVLRQKTTVCPNCAHCMAIPPDYARSEAKCGACGHVYAL